MSRSDTERIQDIKECCHKLAEIASKGRRTYDKKWVLRDAAILNLSIVGEALNSLSDEFLASHTGLPIRDAVSLRNRLLHEYWRTDQGIVWNTITKDIPSLQSAVTKLTEEHGLETRRESGSAAQVIGPAAPRGICAARTKTGRRCSHPAPPFGGRCAAGHLRRR